MFHLSDRLNPRILPEMGVKVSFLTNKEQLTASSDESAPTLMVDARAITDANTGAPYALISGSDNVLEYRPVKIGKILPAGSRL